MSWFSAFQDSHDEVHHKASLAHEALSGAAAFEAAKAYEDHLAREGKPDSHARAKEILAGLVGVAADHLIETKGLDAWDEHKRNELKKKAHQQVEDVVLVEQYPDQYN